jgi:hypothetical protein
MFYETGVVPIEALIYKNSEQGIYRGIGRIVIASNSLRKLAALGEVFKNGHICPEPSGQRIMEPPCLGALEASAYKADNCWDGNDHTMVVASDVLNIVDGNVEHSLSREPHVSSEDMKNRGEWLINTFCSKKTVVTSDVATAVRRDGVKAAGGIRIVCVYNAIPADAMAMAIDKTIEQDPAGFVNRSLGIKLIDTMYPFIEGICISTLNGGDYHQPSYESYSDPDMVLEGIGQKCGENKQNFSEIGVDGQGSWLLNTAVGAIISGVPTNNIIAQLKSIEPKGNGKNLKIVS